MTDILLSPRSKSRVNNFIDHPSHALLLVGSKGIGKAAVARRLGENLLDLPDDRLASYPYARLISPEDSKSIGIEAVRELEHFLALKLPVKPEIGAIRRIVIIEDGHRLTIEAQNALLKTLEEPPDNTLIILTASSAQHLLPTIVSRAQKIELEKPSLQDAQKYFEGKGYSAETVRQALLMSGGLPGITSAILANKEHDLVSAAAVAREILKGSTFDRLCMVDMLAKQKNELESILAILQQMAGLALDKNNAASSSNRRWQQILRASYEASEQLEANTQPKLTLTNLMVNL